MMTSYLTRPHYEYDDFGFCHIGGEFIEIANILEGSKSWPPIATLYNPYAIHYLHHHAVELFLILYFLMIHKIENKERSKDLSSVMLNDRKVNPRELVRCHRIDFLYG